jgi:glycosyltransferase involved in cell wall biosynthesis
VRIAVDAKLLASPGTGIGRYTLSLLSHMIPMGHQWLLYGERPFDASPLASPRVLARYGNAAEGSLKGLWWSQIGYRRWAIQDVVDLFWSPRHHLPLRLPETLPRVVTIHDLVWRQFPETMPRRRLWLERVLMGPSVQKADRVICVSRFTASEISRFYPAAMGKCEVIHCGVEEAAETSAPRVPLPGEFLLFVGTLEPRKNLPRLLRAFARLRDDPTVPPLLIVGAQGWGHEDLARMIAAEGLEGRVLLMGFLEEAELQWVYSRAKCLLMPSLYEGFGLPVLEAMQHGIPVIVSSTSSLPEVAGDAGLLVNPFSEVDIAGAIQRLMADSDLYQSLAAKATQRALRFSWHSAAEQTLSLFEKVLAEHEPKAYRHRARGEQLD